MMIDLTLKITPKMVVDAQGNEKKALVGHLGTHFDVMDREFPLSYIRRNAVVFDVSSVKDRDIDVNDIDFTMIDKGMFVGFYTGFIEFCAYGSKMYFSEHPQLSHELIDFLVQKEVSIIGVDFAGVRRGKEHTITDQKCVEKGVFVVENLCNLERVVGEKNLVINTFPMNYAEITGLPCRVVAETKSDL